MKYIVYVDDNFHIGEGKNATSLTNMIVARQQQMPA
jgi:hypothetical protein